MRSRLTLGLVAGVLLTGVMFVPTATAANRPDTGQPTPEVLALAAERGVSIAAARRTVDAHRRAAALADPLREALSDGVFGGLWIGDDDRIKIGLAGGTPSAAAHGLAASYGLTGLVDVVPVRHSAADLDDASAWFDARLAATDAGAEATLQVGQSPRDNAVELLLPRGATLTTAQRQLVADARTRFGDLLEVGYHGGRTAADGCEILRCDPPLRGGIRAVGGQVCTIAFAARGRSGGGTYALSAGHCQGSSWSVTQSDGSQRQLGSVSAEVFDRRGDAAIIRVDNPNAWNPRPWVYVAQSRNTTWDPQYTISSDGKAVQGQRVCMTGATSATQCGKIVRLNLTVTYTNYGNTRVRHLDEASYCSRGGDSGGPVYSGHTAYGIHTAGHRENGKCRSFNQRIRTAEDLLNVDIITG